MEMCIGRVVYSCAGRDKGQFYAIVALDAKGAYIADGGQRRLEKPKLKNPRHLRLTAVVLTPEQIATNKALRRTLSPGDFLERDSGEVAG